jgi:antitoxin component HigA of HigAB toxin-antitoxin module
MKLKNFQALVDQYLTKAEIAELEVQAKYELKALQDMQESLKSAMNEYMVKNEIGFNELVKKLKSNPRQVARIQQGKANLTLASIAQIATLLGQSPQITFKKR